MKITRKIHKKLIIFAIFILFSGCQEDISILESGTFVGTFKVSEGQLEQANPAKVTFDGIHYNSQAQDNRFPAGGSGYWSIQDKVIAFTDTNIWTADFDWGLILNGTYQYSMEGKRLKLWKTSTNGSKTYVYELEKQ